MSGDDAVARVLALADMKPAPAPQDVSRLKPGGSRILDAPDTVPAAWGDGDQVLWARGEALMLVGPPGVGKTTIAGQLVRARLGLVDQVLGWPVQPGNRRLLYLAMDRPQQIARSLRRLFTEDDRDTLDERLVRWSGPPPADLAQDTNVLVELARSAGADSVVVDSLKDAAIGLTDDAVAGGYNRARQACIEAGVEILELHHQVKRGTNGGKPTPSPTSTAPPGSPQAPAPCSCCGAPPEMPSSSSSTSNSPPTTSAPCGSSTSTRAAPAPSSAAQTFWPLPAPPPPGSPPKPPHKPSSRPISPTATRSRKPAAASTHWPAVDSSNRSRAPAEGRTAAPRPPGTTPTSSPSETSHDHPRTDHGTDHGPRPQRSEHAAPDGSRL